MSVICLTLLLCLRKLRSVVLFPNSGSLNGEPLVLFVRNSVWLVCIASSAIVVIYTTLCLHHLLEIFTLQLKSGRKKFQPVAFQSHNETVTFTKIGSQIKTWFIIVPFPGNMESIAAAKSFAQERTDTAQENLSVGSASIIGSFFSAYPVTGSLSRTAVQRCNTFGSLFIASVVISALMFSAPAFKYIPEALLAALIMAKIIFNFDYEIVKQLFVIKKAEFVTVNCTIVMCCLTLPNMESFRGSTCLFFSLFPLSRPGLKIKSFKGVLVLSLDSITG